MSHRHVVRRFDDVTSQQTPPDACDEETGGTHWRTYGLAQDETVDLMMGFLGDGERVGVHSHPDTTHYSCIVSGTAVAWIDGEAMVLGPGDFFTVPKDVPHDFGAINGDHCWVMDVTSPPWDPGLMQMRPDLQQAVTEALDALGDEA